jgi:hypothetical protein
MESTQRIREEILRSMRSLPTIARIRLLLELFEEEQSHLAECRQQLKVLEKEADADESRREPALLPEDCCPYSPEELRNMRHEAGGRRLDEILSRLGLS